MSDNNNLKMFVLEWSVSSQMDSQTLYFNDEHKARLKFEEYKEEAREEFEDALNNKLVEESSWDLTESKDSISISYDDGNDQNLITLNPIKIEDADDSFVSVEDTIQDRFNEMENQEEKLSFCEMLEEIAFDLKESIRK